MKAFAVKNSIRAAPDRIWGFLTDARAYPLWNSTVAEIDGQIVQNGRITVHPTINRGRAFPVMVVVFEPWKRMVWIGGMPFGLFKGERTFTLTPSPKGDVEFSMREEYSGLLAPLIGRSIPDLQPAFDQFASDLKRAAEENTDPSNLR